MDIETALAEIINIFNGCEQSLAGAIRGIKEASPILKDFIKAYGVDDERTCTLATAIAENAIDTTIKAFNHCSRAFINKVKSDQSCRQQLIEDYRKDAGTVRHIFDFIGQMPVSAEFRQNRLERQVELLDRSLRAFNDFTAHADEPAPATESTDRKDAKTESVISTEKKSLPLKAVATVLTIIVVVTIGIVLYDYSQEKSLLNDITANYTEEDIMAYLSDDSNTHYTTEALNLYLQKMDSIMLNPRLMSQPSQYPPLVRMDNFSRQKALDSDIRQVISQRVMKRTDSLYNIASRENTLASWHKFQALAPTQYYKDSNEKIDSLETVVWASEPTAWQAAVDDDTKDAYTRYIELYPHGAHHVDAEGRLIDLEVFAYKNRGKAIIESIDWITSLPGEDSMVFVLNKTAYDMHFLFSGPTSRKMTIKPDGTSDVTLKNGEYHILVIIDNKRNDRFSFTQSFTSGVYSSALSVKD